MVSDTIRFPWDHAFPYINYSIAGKAMADYSCHVVIALSILVCALGTMLWDMKSEKVRQLEEELQRASSKIHII